ncbi:hypothetical protein JZ751_019848 [Albula glossodonta]|uniref:Uncharacterized protein n=1 Tax=Albula glossodonta TaxID=121402 RepID=A0A8T2NM26_9TELE|nr:hypothetical protein JZ751_019848 [Albula glossodonta]
MKKRKKVRQRESEKERKKEKERERKKEKEKDWLVLWHIIATRGESYLSRKLGDVARMSSAVQAVRTCQ